MGIYDVMDEIANKQVLKTDSGDNRIFGIVIGTVVNNFDKNVPGKVCVQIPVRDRDANELRWARVAMPSSGKNWGMYFIPEVGDQVLLAFEQGNIQRPYIIGSVPMEEKSRFIPSQETVLQYNQQKKITTRNGNSILFEDGYDDQNKQDPKGKKDKIIIQTGTKDQYHKLTLDNENSQIQLSDKSGSNQITIHTGDDRQSIELVCGKKLDIKVGDNIHVVMNGETGAVSIKCEKFTVDAADNAELKAKKTNKLSGASVKISANNSFQVDSKGTTKIGGNPIKFA